MDDNQSNVNFKHCFVCSPNNLCLNLSNCPLIEAIRKMVHIKNQLSPVYDIHFKGLLHHLRALELEFDCILYPSFITDVFWSNFVPYLINKGLALSTIKLLCSQLKMSVEWAGKHGARIANSYNEIWIPSYVKRRISLSPDEVSHIYHFNIDAISRRRQYKKTLESVKDMFVLSCNLGQRYSDMVRMDISCFHDNIFAIRQQKTGALSRVDIDKMSIDKNTTYRILHKYQFQPPYQGCYNRYNQYLRELLGYIGEEFTSPVRLDTKVNGKIDTRMVQKLELITSHTARRTFITNNVLRGFSVPDIMRASGHKTYSTFALYLCYKDE